MTFNPHPLACVALPTLTPTHTSSAPTHHQPHPCILPTLPQPPALTFMPSTCLTDRLTTHPPTSRPPHTFAAPTHPTQWPPTRHDPLPCDHFPPGDTAQEEPVLSSNFMLRATPGATPHSITPVTWPPLLTTTATTPHHHHNPLSPSIIAGNVMSPFM